MLTSAKGRGIDLLVMLYATGSEIDERVGPEATRGLLRPGVGNVTSERTY